MGLHFNLCWQPLFKITLVTLPSFPFESRSYVVNLLLDMTSLINDLEDIWTNSEHFGLTEIASVEKDVYETGLPSDLFLKLLARK